MAKMQFSSKRLQISKANLAIVIVVSAASFLTVFSLVAAKSLWAQYSYQSKVISQKKTAKTTLQDNLKARDQLVSQYKLFVSAPTNIISGITAGTGDRDGDNAKIILDALPSKYDYPALATSLEKLMQMNNLTITNITGTDDELNQAAAATGGVPVAVDMPFQIGFDGSPDSTQAFLTVLLRSIRPIQVQKISISGNDTKLSTTIDAKTYYQPEKVLNIQKQAVKR